MSEEECTNALKKLVWEFWSLFCFANNLSSNRLSFHSIFDFELFFTTNRWLAIVQATILVSRISRKSSVAYTTRFRMLSEMKQSRLDSRSEKILELSEIITEWNIKSMITPNISVRNIFVIVIGQHMCWCMQKANVFGKYIVIRFT